MPQQYDQAPETKKLDDKVMNKWCPVAHSDLELSHILENTNSHINDSFSLRDSVLDRAKKTSDANIVLLPAIAYWWRNCFKPTSAHMFNIQPMGAPVSYASCLSEAKAIQDDIGCQYSQELQIVTAKSVPLFFTTPDTGVTDPFWTARMLGTLRLLDSKLISVSMQMGYKSKKDLKELLQDTTDINRILCSPLLKDFIKSVPDKTALIGYSDSLIGKEIIISSGLTERTQGLIWAPYMFSIRKEADDELQVRGRWAWNGTGLHEYPYHMHVLVD